jgi:hypothetical protein
MGVPLLRLLPIPIMLPQIVHPCTSTCGHPHTPGPPPSPLPPPCHPCSSPCAPARDLLQAMAHSQVFAARGNSWPGILGPGQRLPCVCRRRQALTGAAAQHSLGLPCALIFTSIWVPGRFLGGSTGASPAGKPAWLWPRGCTWPPCMPRGALLLPSPLALMALPAPPSAFFFFSLLLSGGGSRATPTCAPARHHKQTAARNGMRRFARARAR